MTQIPIGDLGVNYRKPLPDSKESLGGPGTELLIKERSKQKKAIGISHLYVDDVLHGSLSTYYLVL